MLVPGARLDDVVSRLEREPPDTRQEDVVSSAILQQRPGWIKVAIRVRRSLIISAVFDTEHEVSFERARRAPRVELEHGDENRGRSPTRAPRTSVPSGRMRTADLLWSWNAYWRYEQVEQGVLVECESVTLSRPVPFMLKPVAGPIVGHVARESMDRTLAVFRERFRKDAQR